MDARTRQTDPPLASRPGTRHLASLALLLIAACVVDGAPEQQQPAPDAADAQPDVPDPGDIETRDDGADTPDLPDTTLPPPDALDLPDSDDAPDAMLDASPDADADAAEPDVEVEGCEDRDQDGAAGSGSACDVLSPAYDCDDRDPARHPGAAEECDGVDDDCDGDTDEGVDNGCGGCSALDEPLGGLCGDCGRLVCDGPSSTRCDDPGFNPCGGCLPLPQPLGASCGVCGRYSCDGTETLQCQEGAPISYYLDADGDGYGGTMQQLRCAPGEGYTTALGGDCADYNTAIHPGAEELCDGLDNNCAGGVDDSPVDCLTTIRMECLQGVCVCTHEECFGTCCGPRQYCDLTEQRCILDRECTEPPCP